VALFGAARTPTNPDVDHIKPHKGNLALFWDEANLQSLCKKCHDGEKQKQDKAAQRAGGVGLKSGKPDCADPSPCNPESFFLSAERVSADQGTCDQLRRLAGLCGGN